MKRYEWNEAREIIIGQVEGHIVSYQFDEALKDIKSIDK